MVLAGMFFLAAARLQPKDQAECQAAMSGGGGSGAADGLAGPLLQGGGVTRSGSAIN